MKTAVFDFERIGTIGDFYKIATTELNLPEYFGNNWTRFGIVLQAKLSCL